MTTETVLPEIEESILNADLSELKENVKILVESTSDMESSQKLAEILYRNYTQYKSDYLAKVMETIIQVKPTLALVNHPENFLFKAALMTGSVEMYECYIDEAIIPFLSNVDPEEHELHYAELQDTAQLVSDWLFKEYPKCIKGMDYNGSFGEDEDNENVVLINREDYELMEDVVEKYNTIVGRKDIIKDLNKRSGLNL